MSRSTSRSVEAGVILEVDLGPDEVYCLDGFLRACHSLTQLCNSKIKCATGVIVLGDKPIQFSTAGNVLAVDCSPTLLIGQAPYLYCMAVGRNSVEKAIHYL
jgi:hypothetical protein